MSRGEVFQQFGVTNPEVCAMLSRAADEYPDHVAPYGGIIHDAVMFDWLLVHRVDWDDVARFFEVFSVDEGDVVLSDEGEALFRALGVEPA